MIDPTENVIALVSANKERADDLRAADERLAEERYRHVEVVAKLRATHNKEMRDSMKATLEAQRREDQATALADKKSVLDAVQTLANTTESIRLQLEKRVADSAETLAKAKSESDKATEVRVSALEKIAFTGAGEKAVADPAMAQLVIEIKKLSEGAGERRGGSQFMMTAITIGLVLIAIATLFLRATGK